MKKTIYPVSSALLSWVSFCMQITAAQHQLPPQTGTSFLVNQWRVGFGLAVEYLNTEAKLKLHPDENLEFVGSQQSQTGKHFQVAPCLEFGNTFGNSYYLGLMVSWRYVGLKSEAKSVIVPIQFFQHEFKLKHYTDILMKAGYQMSPRTMVYGLIGPSITNWTHSSTQFEDNQTAVDRFKINKTSIGLCLGVGVECYVNKDYTLSIDYTHHLHSPVSKSRSMRYEIQNPLGGLDPHSGELNKKIDLSYSTIAIRFTKFFSF